MGLFGDPAREWTACAYALGLPLHPVVRPIEPQRDGVATIRRRLGPAGAGGLPDSWWIAAKRNDVEFVVGGRTETESGGHDELPRTTYFTHCIAEIDPPLWIGLRLAFQKNGLFEPETPAFVAWDPHRLQQMLAWRANDGYDAHEMVNAAHASRLAVQLDDHSVRFTARERITDPTIVGNMITGATLVAERLRAARARIGPAQWEVDAAAAWQLFAGRHGLKFDRERFHAEGTAETSQIDVRVVGGASPTTRFRLRYAQRLAMGLRITVGSVSWLGELLGAQDITVGDPVFDQAFRVQGQPEAMVRQLCGPETRRCLVHIAQRGASVSVENDKLEMRVPGMLLRFEDLDAFGSLALGVVRGFWRW